MRILSVILLAMFSIALQAQQPAPKKANYALAARFAPGKISKMLFSTSVDPHWLKLSDR